jgi:glycosyltransferase involved in cell wall biosynthesis
LKKGILDFVKTEDEEKLIIAYSAHTPFLAAAAYAKKKDPRIKICLVVPDIPQFMNLNANRSRLYDLAKKYDIKKMNRLMGCVDSFILLTEHMKERLPVGEKPCQITEGIIEKSVFYENEEKKEALKKDSSLKYVVYTGTTNAKYGIMSLVQAFSHLPDENLRLVICGSGDSDGMIRQAAENDARILAMGQVPSEKAREWVLKADVLVNPRPNNEEYTRYSFPSKNVEYLASGNPVVAHLLDGMKPVYKEFIIQPQEDSPESLAKAIEIALTHKTDVGAFRQYAEELTAPNVIQRIIELNFKS